MDYDSARGMVVLFGGFDGSLDKNDTWGWNGSTWTLLTASGATPRSNFAMAYDAGRSRTVVFGGYDASGRLGDTWEWDGQVWAQVATMGPSARGGTRMVYDGARGVVTLFGGYDGTAGKGDTWQFTGAAPAITQSPTNQTVWIGQPAQFAVQAAGRGAFAYQWSKDGVPLNDSGRISGATTATLSIDPATVDDAGTYSVVAIDACGSPVSASATLVVTTPAADFDHDGDVDLGDFALFQLHFGEAG